MVERCLTPEAGGAMQALVDGGALRPVLEDEFTLLAGSVRAQEVELRIADRARRQYAVTLALSRSGDPDGQGERFFYYLGAAPPAAHPRAAAVLLGLASLVDAAIPDSALARCSGAGEPRGERRYPRRLVLAAAVAQLAALAAAIVHALRSL